MSGNKKPIVEWWANPERKCVDDIRFTNLPKGRSAPKEVAELVYLCYQCPVIAECNRDASAPHKYPLTGVVQGGELWL